MASLWYLLLDFIREINSNKLVCLKQTSLIMSICLIVMVLRRLNRCVVLPTGWSSCVTTIITIESLCKLKFYSSFYFQVFGIPIFVHFAYICLNVRCVKWTHNCIASLQISSCYFMVFTVLLNLNMRCSKWKNETT